MARSRNIKPGFYKNYDLADAGPLAQLLFSGLWCLADKEGRLEDKPRLIKAEIFPYYDCDVNGELTVLARLGFICRYVVDGVSVIEVQNFKEHQNPHHTEKASRLPKNDSKQAGNPHETVIPDINGELTVNSPSKNGEYLADSRFLIPDSLIPDSFKEPNGSMSPAKLPTCPTQKIVDLYHEVLPNLPTVRLMPDKRKRVMLAFWRFALTEKKSDGTPRATNAQEAVDWTRQFFERAKDNDFLMGKTKKDGVHAGWECDLDFLLSEKGRVQVIEKTRDSE